jgi:hypothetical protein
VASSPLALRGDILGQGPPCWAEGNLLLPGRGWDLLTGTGVGASFCCTVLACQREEAAGLGGTGYIMSMGGPSELFSGPCFQHSSQRRVGVPGLAFAHLLTTCVWNVQMFPWGLQLPPPPSCPASGL